MPELPMIRSLIIISLVAACALAPAQDRTNIVNTLADDLGHGDLVCYGQTRIHSPNLDRIAIEGMRFTCHYAGATVCAPNRSCRMTGVRTGQTPIRGSDNQVTTHK
jgi:arylsulfatase A-like enzyme